MMKHSTSVIEYPANVDVAWFREQLDDFLGDMWTKHHVPMACIDLADEGPYQTVVDSFTKTGRYWDEQDELNYDYDGVTDDD
ncbi:hypothetical protein GPK34_01075 [Secundilactobacillus kimchicus]|uniref:hypothetical protein n=1 Tax=Secundilactobacillus kimchicus TaxID=528209 RepID=UPI001C00CFF0|nr:hypothetical protein [Secundilactobacillus kimchicus]MBT9670630.1 hypothetical protein [Secundilactobacillus kimchicus]